MGLTVNSTGIKAAASKWYIQKHSPKDKIIAIAGNPNVGKSTVFNALTGMNQHTGNWPGKTVASAQGLCRTASHSYVMVDIPGTYSLMAHSAEEEVARNFICFGGADAVVIICDATCLERNLNLVLQTMEITGRVVLCVNLMDEARRRHIQIDLAEVSRRLGIPVIGTNARKKSSLRQLTDALDTLMETKNPHPLAIPYGREIEEALALVEPAVRSRCGMRLPSRWLLIWLSAHISWDSISLLSRCAGFVDPFARLMGLDGTILIAFILGLPANEIVVPIIIMAYLSQGSLLELNDLGALKTLLLDNGWTINTAVCTCLFSLMHWPCSTTLLTIKKETGSIRWMLLALLIPTIAGILCCMAFTFFMRCFLPGLK